jgi:hypothetical protein
MSFHVVSHEKIFSEAMCTQDDVSLLIFPVRIFIREIRKTYTILIVFLLNYLRGYESFSQYIKNDDLHFSRWVFKGLYKSTLLIFSHMVFGGV